jgi:capsular exopolysaccharide synthesis family protein
VVRKSSTGGANVLSTTVSDLTFKDLVGILGRQKWLILIIALIFLVIGAGVTALIPAQFTAITRILVEGRTMTNPGTTGSVEEVISRTGGSYDVPTQIQLLESQEVLIKVFERSGVPNLVGELREERGPRIEVRQLLDTNVVQVQVTAPTERLASDMATVLPEVFSEFVITKSAAQVSQATQFVSRRLEEEGAALEKARGDVAAFQATNRMLDSQAEVQRQLNQEQINAGAAREDQQAVKFAEASVREAERSLDSLRRDAAALPRTVRLPIVRTNRNEIVLEQRELAVLESEREALLIRYQPEHRAVREIEARIAEKKQYLDALEKVVTEEQTVRNPEIDSYEARVTAAEAALAGARARYESLRAAAGTASVVNSLKPIDPELTRQLSSLQSIVRGHEATIEELRRTADALKLRDNALKQPTTNITRQAFARQTRPSWGLNLVLATLLGLLVGVFVALSRDIGQDKVLSTRNATAIADTIVLARIPKRPANQPPVIFNPNQALTFEAYRMLRTNLAFADQSKPVKSVLVTSSVSKEGVSTVAANLAVAFAQEGRKVVLVDANLRNPKVSTLFGKKDAQGLVQIIKDRLDPTSFLLETEVPKLSILPAGGQIGNPTEALASELMKNLVASLEESHNIVIIDAPSAYSTADAHQLADMVDGVVYVVDPELPSKIQMAESIDMLRHAGGRVLGLVINRDKTAASRLV